MENIFGIIFFFVLVGLGFMAAAIIINVAIMAVVGFFMFLGWVYEKITGGNKS